MLHFALKRVWLHIDETAMKLLHTLLRVCLPILEMAIDADLVAQNGFTFSYEGAKT
jgi:hypothetical protein